mgnify:CR=1 FL=1
MMKLCLHLVQEFQKLKDMLNSGILTKEEFDKAKKKILNEISFGGGAVNDAIMHIANSKLPFGGIGNSGIGSYHGEAGFKSFSHFKSILEKSNLMELSLKYYPHSKRKLSWIQRFMGF